MASLPVDSTQEHMFISPSQVLETLRPYLRTERNALVLDVLKIIFLSRARLLCYFLPQYMIILMLILVAINWTSAKAVCCFILLDLSVTGLPEFSAMRKPVLTKAVILKLQKQLNDLPFSNGHFTLNYRVLHIALLFPNKKKKS